MRARDLLYPAIFKTAASNISYDLDTNVGESKKGDVLDGEMGIDRVVRVTVKSFMRPFVFTVQERFRQERFKHYKDLTVTEWNHATNLPSELYKITAGLFVYGYFDERNNVFADAIAVNIVGMLTAIARGDIAIDKRRNGKAQSFIALKFDALHKANTVIWRKPATVIELGKDKAA